MPRLSVVNPRNVVVNELLRRFPSKDEVLAFLIDVFVHLHIGSGKSIDEFMQELQRESQPGTAEAWLEAHGFGKRFDGAWIKGYKVPKPVEAPVPEESESPAAEAPVVEALTEAVSTEVSDDEADR